jgi:hypothetical protein
MPKTTPNKKSTAKKSNIFVRAVNKFSNLHAPAKVLVLALVIGVVGGGGYAVYMSSAAGWSYIGTEKYYVSESSKNTKYVDYKIYQCKTSVPKRGYLIKSKLEITKVSNITNKIAVVFSTEGGKNYSIGNYIVPKVGSTSNATSTYIASNMSFSANGTSGPTAWISGAPISFASGYDSMYRYAKNLSTCP